MKAQLVKTISGMQPFGYDSEAWYNKKKLGVVVEVEAVEVRNNQFFRKWFALLNIGFDNWEPIPTKIDGMVVEKNFERYRHDVIILCGFYNRVFRLDGSMRIEPKSVSFAKMSEETFQDLYSKTIDVLLKNVYNNKIDAEELERIVQKYLDFT